MDKKMEKGKDFTVKEIALEKAFKEYENYDIEKDFRYPYHLTPYQGCAFRCRYCFNYKSSKYWTDIDDRKNQIVVATNIVDLVREELPNIKESPKMPLMVRIGTEAEIYGPAEETYMLTRGILEAFRETGGWHIRIPTKSDLVLRDKDILKDLDCMVTTTLTTTDEDNARKLEPHAPSVERRVDMLRNLREAGIRCRIRCEPYIEGISDLENMEMIKDDLGLEEVKVKPLNYFSREEIMRLIK